MSAKDASKDQTPVDELAYEQALQELETIIATLEANQLPLEDTMALYERGQALTKHCLEMLEKAELRVKKLSGDTLVDMGSEN